jgi:outer membrane protein OmpA-like peptidoglycan-associated protein
MRPLVRAALIGLVGGSLACAPKVSTPQTGVADPATRTTVVLLPDPDSGRASRATVRNGDDAVVLDAPGEGTEVARGTPPSAPRVVDTATVQALFGEAMAALPPSPRVFTLYFRFESNGLTETSQARLAAVLQSVRQYPAPAVTVVGHTDTAGDAARNMALGRQRADVVRKLLIDAGLDPASIDVVSHGESDPLVPTPDSTPEPRNRRVDVVVR